MKRKCWLGILLALVLAMTAVCFTACGDKGGKDATAADLEGQYYYHRAAVTGDGSFKHLY